MPAAKGSARTPLGPKYLDLEDEDRPSTITSEDKVQRPLYTAPQTSSKHVHFASFRNKIIYQSILRNIHLTSIYLIKTYLFYVSVLSCDEDEAVRWATEVLKMTKVNCFIKLSKLIVGPPQITELGLLC